MYHDTELKLFKRLANLDVEILLGKSTHHLDPEIRKMLKRGTRIIHSILVHDLLAIEIKILPLTKGVRTRMF